MKKKAVVLYSGGLDSTTCMAIARADGLDPYAISFAYGQRHSIELDKARQYASRIGAVDHQLVQFDLRPFGGSSLTSEQEVPKDRPMDDAIPTTYVPARNTIFLSFAPSISRRSRHWRTWPPGPALKRPAATGSMLPCST